MTEDEREPASAAEPTPGTGEAADPDPSLPNSKVSEPADLTELSPDGPRRTAPMFDNRPAVLKNPAQLPETGQHADLDEAAFASLTENLAWVDKPVPSEEENRARQERHEAYKRMKRRQRRQRKAIIWTASVLAFLLLLAAFWFRYTFGGLDRMPSVHGQAGANTPGQNFLLVGTNPSEPVTRDGREDWRDDFANSDLVMVVHVTRDNRSMFVISLPRDSAVQIPGHGVGKLPDAYGLGGAELYVKTVEEHTGLRMDRVMTLDLDTFREMADLFDGVIVNVPASVCDEPAGQRRLDGQSALEYIALRSCMEGQDLDRVARQQSLMKALMRSAVDGGTVTHPIRVNKLLRSGASHTTLEDGFGYPGILGTLWSLRHLRTTNTTFLTVPVTEPAITEVDGTSFVRLDEQKGAELWDAVRRDQLAEYLQLSGIATN